MSTVMEDHRNRDNQVNRIIESYEEYKENHIGNSNELISIGEYIELQFENDEENSFREFLCPEPEDEDRFQKILSENETKKEFVKECVIFVTNQYELKES